MTEPNPPVSGPSRNRLPLIAALGAVGLLVVAAALWVLLRDDAPAAVSLDAATAELTDDGSGDEAAAGDGAAADNEESASGGSEDSGAEDSEDSGAEDSENTEDSEADGDSDDASQDAGPIQNVSGDWAVDTSIGEFSFEDSTGSYVGFRVGEELTTVGVTEAVGRTPAVAGIVTIDGETVTAVNIEADMSAITTDISRRDSATRRALDTDSFPSATFVLTEPIELGADPAAGEPISATATGDLTVHGVTNSVELAIDAQLVDNVIAIVGTTDVVFADYGVTPPSAPVVVSLEDFGVIEFQLFLVKS